jgi:hypothetical protein
MVSVVGYRMSTVIKSTSGLDETFFIVALMA